MNDIRKQHKEISVLILGDVCFHGTVVPRSGADAFPGCGSVSDAAYQACALAVLVLGDILLTANFVAVAGFGVGLEYDECHADGQVALEPYAEARKQ